MRVTIVREDNFICIDGVKKNVDLSFLSSDIHAIQYNNGIGFIESLTPDEGGEIKKETEIPEWSKIQEVFKSAEEIDPPTENALPNNEELMELLRAERDFKLQQSDVLILKSFEAGETVSPAIKAYREALREIPNKVMAKKLPMPTWDNNTMNLIFENWPSSP